MGSEGTVVAVWNGGEAFDVEFVRPVETLAAILPTALQLVERKDGAFMNLLKGVHHISARTIPNLLAFHSSLPTPKARPASR